MNNYEKTKRIFSVDLIRAICPFGILLYHYSCQYKNGPQPFSTYANGSWGYVFVTVFFMLSGVSLYHNYTIITKKIIGFFSINLSIIGYNRYNITNAPKNHSPT